MTDPEAPWLPLDRVRRQCNVENLPANADRLNAIGEARLAAATAVEEARKDLISDDTFTPTEAVVQGAAMWAARLYARKGSPTGLVSFGEFGAAQASQFDADVERLIGVNRYARPVVG